MIDLQTIHAKDEETKLQFQVLSKFMIDTQMSTHTIKAILNSDRFTDYLLNCTEDLTRRSKV